MINAMNQQQKCPLCNSAEIKDLRRYQADHLARCGYCHFVFSRAIPTIEELSVLYSEYSYGGDYYVSPITRERYRAIIQEFEPFRKHNRLLDVGCGNGQLLSVAREMGWECYGTEVSGRAVKLCREQGFEVHEDSLAETIEKLPECDVLISIDVIEHLSTPAEEVRLMHRALRTGGLMYITTPNFNGLLRLITGKDHSIIGYPEHLGYFTPNTLRRLAIQSGFKVKKVQSTGFSITAVISITRSKFVSPANANSADETLRRVTESKSGLNFIKHIANWFFNLTGTGNALKGWFVKC